MAYFPLPLSASLTSVLVLAACAQERSSSEGERPRMDHLEEVPDGWRTLDTGCEFTFSAPADVEQEPTQGVDSCVVRYASPDCAYFADYGWYSGDFESSRGELEFAEQRAWVSGSDASLMEHRGQEPRSYVVGLHVPQVSRTSPAVKLTFSAECVSEKARETARTVLLSVTFPETH